MYSGVSYPNHTADGILTFMIRINFMLSKGEHEKSFKNSDPRQVGPGGQLSGCLYF